MFGEFSKSEARLLEALQMKSEYRRSKRYQQLFGGNCVDDLLFRFLALCSLGAFTFV